MTTLYSFCAETNCTDGSEPSAGQLVQATDGNFYGTTQSGPHPDHSEIASFSSTTSPMTALSSSTDRSFITQCSVCILHSERRTVWRRGPPGQRKASVPHGPFVLSF